VKKKSQQNAIVQTSSAEYVGLIGGIAELLDAARHSAARSVNALMTATYWEIGRRIVEFEQGGKSKAQYGGEVIDQLASDLTMRFGRGFGRRNLFQIRAFYLAYPSIVQTPSAQSGKGQTLSVQSDAWIVSTASIELADRKGQTPPGKSRPKNRPTPSSKSQPKHFRDTVSEIACDGLRPRRSSRRLSSALVPLRPAALGQK
jgi:hypothetical protein